MQIWYSCQKFLASFRKLQLDAWKLISKSAFQTKKILTRSFPGHRWKRFDKHAWIHPTNKPKQFCAKTRSFPWSINFTFFYPLIIFSLKLDSRHLQCTLYKPANFFCRMSGKFLLGVGKKCDFFFETYVFIKKTIPTSNM